MVNKKSGNRRKFLKNTAFLSGAGMLAPGFSFGIIKSKSLDQKVVGHGNYKYRVDKDWGAQDSSKIPVKDCHEMVQDANGRLILLTNETANNIIVYDKSGKVLTTWGEEFPGAHGLTITLEGGEEFLFITDYERHKVFKTTLDGKILMSLDYPRETGVYEKAEQYKPTEVAVAPNGDFYVADGYGLDYIIQYNYKGEYIRHFGGKGDGEKQFDTAHGVCLDLRNKDNPVLLITSRSKQEFKRFSLDGKHLSTVKIPGSWMCRPVIDGDELYFAVIVSKTWWAYDGYVILLDQSNKIISAPGGSKPIYNEGSLKEIKYDGSTFLNPHDVCVDDEKNLYIPQWYSGRTYPVKLERV